MIGVSRALRAAGSWCVTRTDKGARLATRTELDLPGLFKLAAPLVRRQQQGRFQRDMENIRARLEAAEPAPSGGCPCMFIPTADTSHKVMRAIFTLTGKVPRRV
jgi:hypothetical protein